MRILRYNNHTVILKYKRSQEMNNARFLIIAISKSGIFEYRLDDFDAQELSISNHCINKFSSLLENILFHISLYELINDEYKLVREIHFAMLEQENLNNIEELVRCTVWHYNDDRFIVLDDDSTYEYLEEYRSAIQS
jgi:hypothetical protein